MTLMPITCDTFAAHLADHLESDATPAIRDAMDGHASSCAACAAILHDLEAIRNEAAALPVLAPSRDLWSGIAERIDARVVPISSRGGRRAAGVTAQRRHPRRWWAHPAFAAAALVGITAGITNYITRESIVASGPSFAQVAPEVRATGASAEAVPPGGGIDQSSESAGATDNSVVIASPARHATAAQVRLAPGARRPTPDVVAVSYRQGDIAALDSLYYREIIRLRTLLGERRTQLDPGTVAVIDRNMIVIDRAIQECRAALAADPASKFLNQQLNDALESKIELLRTAAMMPVGS